MDSLEIEQDKEQMSIHQNDAFRPVGDVFELSAKKTDSRFQNPFGEDSQLFDKVIARLYEWLNSLSGSNAFAAARRPSSTNKLLLDVFRFLREEGVLKDYMIRKFRYNDIPSFFRIDMMPAYKDRITDGRIPRKLFAHGFGKSIETVFSQALGEFLERYFLTLYRRDALLRASPAILKRKKFNCIDLNLIAGFSEKQKDRISRYKWDEESIFSWEWTERIATKGKVLVPAQLVYWTYALEEREPRLRETNTNGAGGYFSREGAILSGLYELIQRDAFVIFWLNSISPPKIDPATVPSEEFQELYQASIRYGFKVHCLNITSDIGIPIFAVIIEDETKNWPRLSMGMGCNIDPLKALNRAFIEAWSVYDWLRPRTPYSLKEQYIPFSDSSIGQDERCSLFANPLFYEKVSFLLGGQEHSFSDSLSVVPPLNSEKEEMNHLVEHIEGLGDGYQVYAFEAKSSILSTIGYHSVRVIVPKLVSLYLHEIHAPLGAKRLKEMPLKLGLHQAEEFNPIPHPFP